MIKYLDNIAVELNELSNPLFNRQQQQVETQTVQTSQQQATNSPSRVKTGQPSLVKIVTQQSYNEQQKNEPINENLNSVQNIIEHFQQNIIKNSSPNVNNNQQKAHQTNFAALAFRPTNNLNSVATVRH